MSNFIASRIKGKKDTIDRLYRNELPIVEKDLDEMIAICRDNNIIPVLIKYPTKDYGYRRYKDTIMLIEKVALKNNAYLIDGSSFFESLDEKERATYFVDMAHFSERGNEKMAEIIYSALAKSGYLKAI